jgi:hypothetical protein
MNTLTRALARLLRMADYECTICGGTGWVNGRMCTGTAHSTRAH